MSGKLIIISAPSGSGKTTIVKQVLASDDLKLKFSVSVCSREPRVNETHAKDYYFISGDELGIRLKKRNLSNGRKSMLTITTEH